MSKLLPPIMPLDMQEAALECVSAQNAYRATLGHIPSLEKLTPASREAQCALDASRRFRNFAQAITLASSPIFDVRPLFFWSAMKVTICYDGPVAFLPGAPSLSREACRERRACRGASDRFPFISAL